MAAGIDVGVDSEVTLLTGDRVQLGKDKAGNLTAGNIIQAPRADGRTVAFRTFRHDDDFYVLPSDAIDLVASKRIDKELFNVPEILASTSVVKPGQLPIILSYGKKLQAGVMREKADELPASKVERVLESIDAVAVGVDENRAEQFWNALRPGENRLASGVSAVWLDGKVEANLDESVKQVGAPEAWQAGFDGTGVKVAVLDTGIDANHPDFAGKIVASQSFVAGQEVADGHGHGTHVA